jgi:hypothetical protein
MDDSYLASARAKLRWADRHLRRLNGMNTKYMAESGPQMGHHQRNGSPWSGLVGGEARINATSAS